MTSSPGSQREDTSVEDTSSVVVNLLLVHSLNAMTNHRDTRSAHRRARSRIFQFSRP
jgi:hypothetical protein